MAYELCPDCGTRKHQIVACSNCGFRRAAKLWKPRPENALGKKPPIPLDDKYEANESSQKPMSICSRCHELIEYGGIEKHMLIAHVRVVKKCKSRRIAQTRPPVAKG